jgi:beta-mannosidase
VDPEAIVDRMLVDLLPGETATFFVASSAEVDPADFVTPLVLKTANSLLHLGTSK